MSILSLDLDSVFNSKPKGYKFVVHTKDIDEDSPALLWDEIYPIYDNDDNLVFFKLVCEGLTDYVHKDRINWFRFKKVDENE